MLNAFFDFSFSFGHILHAIKMQDHSLKHLTKIWRSCEQFNGDSVTLGQICAHLELWCVAFFLNGILEQQLFFCYCWCDRSITLKYLNWLINTSKWQRLGSISMPIFGLFALRSHAYIWNNVCNWMKFAFGFKSINSMNENEKKNKPQQKSKANEDEGEKKSRSAN